MMSKDAVRLLVYRQIKLEHPEYTDQRLRCEVDMIVDLINQVREADTYENDSYAAIYGR